MRSKALSELMLEIPGGQLNASNLEDLQLTFQYSPSSSIFTTADNPVVDLGNSKSKYCNDIKRQNSYNSTN